MTPVAPILDTAFVTAFRSGTLTPEQAEAVLPRDRAAAIFFLLQLSITLRSPAPAGGAHQPSGSIPPYAKPSAPPRRKKRGAQPGHTGAARPQPEQIDRRESHQLPACPDCGGGLTRTRRTRTRIVEDIPDDLKPVVTEHTIHRDWCPCCKKQVEPPVPDALPHDYVLRISKPYLGKWISKPYDWTPLKNRDTTFAGYNDADLDRKDPWQFKNFLVTDAG